MFDGVWSALAFDRWVWRVGGAGRRGRQELQVVGVHTGARARAVPSARTLRPVPFGDSKCQWRESSGPPGEALVPGPHGAQSPKAPSPKAEQWRVPLGGSVI